MAEGATSAGEVIVSFGADLTGLQAGAVEAAAVVKKSATDIAAGFDGVNLATMTAAEQIEFFQGLVTGAMEEFITAAEGGAESIGGLGDAAGAAAGGLDEAAAAAQAEADAISWVTGGAAEATAAMEALAPSSTAAGDALNETEQAAAAVAPALEGVAPAAAGAKDGLDGLMQKAMAWRREQVQQGRQARFFAGEISSLIPGAAGAKGALQGMLGVLIEGAAGGLSFGLAMEAFKFGLETVSTAMKQGEVLAGLYAGAQAGLAQSMVAGKEVIRQYNTEMTDGMKLATQAMEAMVPGLESINDAYLKVQEEGLTTWEITKSVFGDRSGAKDYEQRLLAIVALQKKFTGAMAATKAEALDAAWMKKSEDDEKRAEAADSAERVRTYNMAQAGKLLQEQTRLQQLTLTGSQEQRATAEATVRISAMQAQVQAAIGDGDHQRAKALRMQIALEREKLALALNEMNVRQRSDMARAAQTNDEERLAQLVAATGEEMRLNREARAWKAAGYREDVASAAAAMKQREIVEVDGLNRLLALKEITEAEYQHRLDAMRVRNNEEALVAQNGFAVQFVDALASSWSSGLQQMLDGSLSFRDAMGGIWGTIKGAFASVASSMVVEWGKAMARKVLIGEWTAAKEIAIEGWASVKKVAIWLWEGGKAIAIRAWEAAAGAYAAISSIPVVGPFLAPAIAAGLLVAVLGLGSKLASAEGGYDIPRGVNPLVQAHAEEMILPARYANVIRGLASGTADGGGGAAPVSVSLNVQALDGQDVTRVLMNNQGALLKALGESVRNGRRG